jgi:hypothetical protein
MLIFMNIVAPMLLFQLPLSGSRNMAEKVAKIGTVDFQSLSRDHLSTISESARKEPKKLSTPSLGITEPDSGIFRLSAAFCRGTPSHK